MTSHSKIGSWPSTDELLELGVDTHRRRVLEAGVFNTCCSMSRLRLDKS